MHPAEVDAFTWHSIRPVPRGYLAATAGLAILCTFVGFYAGRLSARPALANKTTTPTSANSTPVRQTVVSSLNLRAQEQKNDRDAGPEVVVLNPGTAAPTTSSSENLAKSEPPKEEVHSPPKQSRNPATSSKVTERHERRKKLTEPNYQALRDYVMGR